MSFATISPKELLDLTQAGKEIDLIDVRTPVEYREVHVTFARNLPLDRLDPAAMAAERNGSDRPLYVICRSGNRGKQACEKLLASGCCNIVNVEGGTQACEQVGLPVVRGKKAVSLERQVGWSPVRWCWPVASWASWCIRTGAAWRRLWVPG
jgi:rhodanese-related sulfurtransferase